MKTKLCRPILIGVVGKLAVGQLAILDGKLITVISESQVFAKSQELILISLEDEKIEVGDTCAALKVNSLEDIDKRCKIKEILSERSHNYLAEDGWRYSDSYLQKVIATQSQLSPEYILQFIGEYNRGEVKDVEIEMVDNGYEVDMEGIGGCEIGWMPKFEPKLTNGFITIIEREPILYNEEEVLNMITGYYKYYISAYSPIDTCAMWFEQNKKK